MRSVTTFDPDFTDDDVAVAMAWQTDQESRCPGCGNPRDETLDPARANAYDAEPLACHACAARDRASRAYSENNNGDTDGVFWRIYERG